MKKKNNIEDIIIFLTNTLVSFLLAIYFGTSEGIINMIIGAYFIFNIICFYCVVTVAGVREESYQEVIRRLLDEKAQSSDIHQS